jgi:hypothetical protein
MAALSTETRHGAHSSRRSGYTYFIKCHECGVKTPRWQGSCPNCYSYRGFECSLREAAKQGWATSAAPAKNDKRPPYSGPDQPRKAEKCAAMGSPVGSSPKPDDVLVCSDAAMAPTWQDSKDVLAYHSCPPTKQLLKAAETTTGQAVKGSLWSFNIESASPFQMLMDRTFCVYMVGLARQHLWTKEVSKGCWVLYTGAFREHPRSRTRTQPTGRAAPSKNQSIAAKEQSGKAAAARRGCGPPKPWKEATSVFALNKTLSIELSHPSMACWLPKFYGTGCEEVQYASVGELLEVSGPIPFHTAAFVDIHSISTTLILLTM